MVANVLQQIQSLRDSYELAGKFDSARLLSKAVGLLVDSSARPLAKYNNAHDERGRFASGSGSSGTGANKIKVTQTKATELLQRMKDTGGFSYQPHTDSSPTTGYMVSPYKNREHQIKQSDLTTKSLYSYAIKNRDLLTKSDHYMGGWVDNGTVYLDISVRTDTAVQATKLAQDNGQLAFYDLAKGETVNVEPKSHAGKTRGQVPGSLQKVAQRHGNRQRRHG